MVITESEQAVLRVERYLHPHPMVQRKMETLWLKSQGVDDKTILRLASISRATLFRYYNDYREGGAEKLKEVNFHQPKSKLEEYRSSLEEHFLKNPPATVKQARDEIEKLTGIKRSETQVRRFLHKLGCRPRKIGMIPAKADTEQQEEFLEQKLNPVMDEAKNGERKVFFVDAAHFVLAPFIIERLWKFVKKNCLYSKYYPDFDTFKQAISSCLLHTRDQHKKQLDTLLTLKFQRFDPEAMCG